MHGRELLWILLLPVSILWAGVTRLRRRFNPPVARVRPAIKTVCVGNLHSGGSGKTPLVAEISRRFSEKGRTVILSRGYRGTLSSVGGWVDRQVPDGVKVYGDEVWMTAQMLDLPVYVGADRVRALEAIERHGDYRRVVMDDGFQHLAVQPQCRIVAINVARSPADSFCLPLGDLREGYSALRECSAVVLVTEGNGAEEERWRSLVRDVSPATPIFSATVRRLDGFYAGAQPVPRDPAAKLGFFSGIANPDRFKNQISKIANAVFLKAFPDHHPYGAKDYEELFRLGDEAGVVTFVTTDKDWFKVHAAFVRAGRPLVTTRIRYDLDPQFWYFLESQLETP